MNQYAWKHEPKAQKIYSNFEEYRKELKHHLHLLVTKYVYKWVESIQRNAVDIVIRRPELLDISYCSSQEKLKTENNMQVPISWVVGEINLIELVIMLCPYLIFYHTLQVAHLFYLPLMHLT